MNITELFNPETLEMVIRISVVCLVFLMAWRSLPLILDHVLPEKFTDHSKSIIIKSCHYGLVGITLFVLLDQLGFNLGALLGTAGIFGVAIGFASQSSLSNIICGIFLLSEKPFAVGEMISVSNITGIVHSFDLISVKIRTLDNKLVRLPNEFIFKKEVTNITRFPVRRLNMRIELSLREDTQKVQDLIMSVVKEHPFCLDHPDPVLFLDEMTHASQEFFLGIWLMGDHYLNVKSTILLRIKERLQQNGVELPFAKFMLDSETKT